MKNNAARLLIAGTGSGCGKTTVTTAVLRALTRRGTALAAFKCGPDYIDPMFHTAVLDVPSRNLDLFFAEEAQVRNQLAQHIPADGVGIIEGVMGFYDGVAGNTDTASAAHLARVTETPAVLVVRPRGQSLSLAAEIMGFRDFAPNTLRGVILNGVSAGMYTFYKEIAERAGLPVYGFLPSVPAAEIPSRHLGLVTAGEMQDLQRKIELLADAAEQSLDLDGLLALAQTAPLLEADTAPLVPVIPHEVRIAVAQDKAFCFYYAENLEILQALGAELVPFSPISDKALPENIDGLYLGGGYPELYAEQLAQNSSMRESVRCAVTSGLPTVAECGGFQYLHQTFDGYEMAGVLPTSGRMTKKLQPFGYITLTAQRDNLLCPAGVSIRAHEFHYGASDDVGNGFRAEKLNGRSWACVYASDTLYAGYPHLYFGSNIAFAANFVRKCAGMGGYYDA